MAARTLVAILLLILVSCAANGPELSRPTTTAATTVSDNNSDTNADKLEAVAPPTVSTSTVAYAEEDELVCRRERSINSRIPKKVCRTRAQIVAAKEAGQDTLEQLSRRTFSGTNVGEGGE